MAGKTEYKNQWQRENVDRINLTVPKGRKETIQNAATSQGQSVNAYINQAIDERMKRDNGADSRADAAQSDVEGG